jgi:hypothetical protein
MLTGKIDSVRTANANAVEFWRELCRDFHFSTEQFLAGLFDIVPRNAPARAST